MKILINRRPVEGPWGGGNNFVKAFCDYLPDLGHQVYHQFVSDLDIIFVQDPRYDELKISINEIIRYKRQFPNTKIIQRINECDARKGTDNVDQLLRDCSKFLDKTIFVSNWMKEYHTSRGWHCYNNDVLINGVADYYKPTEKINNGKINIVTHHWSDNYLKGFDIYDKLDNFVEENKDFTFTYIGRERGTFKNTKVLGPLFGEDLAKELGRYDVYVSASRFDPGPNHILESLSCKIPTYSYVNGGGSCEFTGKSHIYENFNQLKNILLEKKYTQNKITTRSWKKCIEELNENTLLKC